MFNTRTPHIPHTDYHKQHNYDIQGPTSIAPFLFIIKVSVSSDLALPREESMSERAPRPIERVTVVMLFSCEGHLHVNLTTLLSELQGGDITPGLEGISHDVFNYVWPYVAPCGVINDSRKKKREAMN